MREAVNIHSVAGLRPDYMGFIFYRKSPRFAGDDFSMPEIPDVIKKVGVFVNESENNILSMIQKHRLRAVQLHGDEEGAFVRKLKKSLTESGHKTELIKAFGIHDKFDFEALKRYRDCDYFLFDTASHNYGGTGIKFNWKSLDRYTLGIKAFISGGIGYGEVEEIVKIKSRWKWLYGVDVNSKAETTAAIKDVSIIKKIKIFIDQKG